MMFNSTIKEETPINSLINLSFLVLNGYGIIALSGIIVDYIQDAFYLIQLMDADTGNEQVMRLFKITDMSDWLFFDTWESLTIYKEEILDS